MKSRFILLKRVSVYNVSDWPVAFSFSRRTLGRAVVLEQQMQTNEQSTGSGQMIWVYHAIPDSAATGERTTNDSHTDHRRSVAVDNATRSGECRPERLGYCVSITNRRPQLMGRIY
jgi:2-oxo-4-hydroxy-4-carboxy--5-ureidoimidazoline (OHCU) decarboxylase